MAMQITEADIQQLIHNPSVQSRAEIAQKIGHGFCAAEFNDNERAIATEIMRLLLRDAAAKVRKSLALELCEQMDVPHDIIWSLANDSDDEVAETILATSPVLQEDELIELVETLFNMRRMLAVTKRGSISAGLSASLAKSGDATIAKSLLENRSAVVAEPTLEVMLERFKNDDDVLDAFVYRGGLPYAFAEKLFTRVADHLKRDLSKRYRLSRQMVSEAASNAKEVAVMEFLSPWMSQQDIMDLVQNMHRNKRLNESIIIRALCAGNLRFFEAALAKKATISIANARVLLMDAGQRGFDALYDAAQMPESFRQAVTVLFKLAQQETSFGKYYHHHFSQRMLERLVEEGHDKKIDNMPFLMSMIGRSIADVPQLH